ncbi:transcriptional regulator [Cutibacterium acnes JCM 18909]|mgnify:FL=1|nr:transcriptional regulator [Cutibacterium acnes JCM 18909]
MLTQELAVPSVIENDARAATIGEWNCRGRHRDSCIYVKAGTGIGAGWVSGGVAYRGSRGLAGDITHLRVHTDNPLPCTCGNSGCLETVASGAAILRQLGRLGSSISTTSQLVTAENSGDPQAVSLVRDAGMRLGEVLSNLVNFLNPVRIVLGGSMSQMGSLLAGVRSELYERCLPMCTEDLVIETSACGADAPLIGMSILDSHMPISQEGNR